MSQPNEPVIPPPPTLAEWSFVDELTRHDSIQVNWDAGGPTDGCADLSCGVHMARAFPDPESVLDTAYDDLARFLTDVGPGEGPYEVATERVDTEQFEAFRLCVMPQRCVVEAADTTPIPGP